VAVRTEGSTIVVSYTAVVTLPALGDLTDVSAEAPVEGDVLTRRGDVWVAEALGLPDFAAPTFLTLDDETDPLVSSLRLEAGENVTFDTSTPNVLRVAASVAPGSLPQNVQNSNYTLALVDSGGHVYKDGGGASTYTIPANSAVAFPVGTVLTFVNDDADDVTIAINTDTLVFSPTGETGSRTLVQYGMATALKIGTTRWIISGVGLA
jgi:hypothetical protein